MRVLKNNILILPIKGGVKMVAGLELSAAHREKERYGKAKVIHIGETVKGVEVDDLIIYDIMAGHFIDLEDHDDAIRVITDFDIKIIL